MDQLSGLVKELSSLCVLGDQEFIFSFSSTIHEETDSLWSAAESHAKKMERRLESWKVFPVQDAKEVQEFLSAATDELQDENIFDDDCDSEKLEEMLQRLEVSIIFLHKCVTLFLPSYCSISVSHLKVKYHL